MVTSLASDISVPDVFCSGSMRQYADMALSGLKSARKAKGMTQAALAEAIGVEPPTISRWEAGEREPDNETLRRVAEILGTSVGAIFGESGAPNVSQVEKPEPSIAAVRSWSKDVPVYGTALGGDLELDDVDREMQVEQTVLEVSDTIELVRRPPAFAGNRNLYAVYVAGSSMEPRYEPGDLLYVDPRRPPAIGDDVVVQLRDGNGHDGNDRIICALIKRLVRRNASGIELEQYNPPLRFKLASQHVSEVHRVVKMAEILGM
jgi:phage repressor protein C with HTH and peptisase S24 domain